MKGGCLGVSGNQGETNDNQIVLDHRRGIFGSFTVAGPMLTIDLLQIPTYRSIANQISLRYL